MIEQRYSKQMLEHLDKNASNSLEESYQHAHLNAEKSQDIPYYRPSQKIKCWYSYDSFDLRFNQIRNSLVDFGIFRTIYTILRWRFGHTNYGIPVDILKLNEQLPVKRPTFETNPQKITYTWLGHSTAVISFGTDCNMIIDPVFSQRCSPYQWIGPKRFRPIACTVDELPKIDAVLVSHDHYDHLDQEALRGIYRRFPDCQFFAGLNSEGVFPRGCRIKGMDWTQCREFNVKGKKFKITFVPVCHWSRRGAFDKNYRLWGGFVILSPTGKKVFYSGDTGYCPIFKQLGQIFKSFDLSILPIGAYLPREFLKNQHIDPNEAITVHQQLNSKKSVGVHWGTFPLGYEHYTAARRDLKEGLQKRGLKEKEFQAIGHGDFITVDYL